MQKSLFSPFCLFTITSFTCAAFNELDAATYMVNNTSSLVSAINSVNGNPAGGDTIQFVAPGTYTLTSNLPSIQLNAGASLTIDGGGLSVVIDGASSFQSFFVTQGNVTFQNFSSSSAIQNAKATGGTGGSGNSGGGGGGGGGLGAGGALFVNNTANVTITNMAFTGNNATGGTGGTGGGGTALIGGGGGGACDGANGGASGSTPMIPSAATGGGGGAGQMQAGNTGGSPITPTAGGSGGNGGGPGGTGGAGGSVSGGFTGKPGNPGTGVGQGGGGGGGGVGSAGSAPGGAGGAGADLGGGGGGGGGGGSGAGGAGALGGFGGGGGGSGNNSNGTGPVGGKGGFGAGGGGGGGAGGGSSTFGGGTGGAGGASSGGGGGGAGFGGAFFVRSGGSLTLAGSLALSGNTVTAGTGVSGGTNGSTAGLDIFLMSGGTLTFTLTSPLTISSVIAADGGASGGGLIVNSTVSNQPLTLTAANQYTGSTSLNNAGLLQISADNNLGAANGSISFGGGTLELLTAFGTNTIARNVVFNSGGGKIQTDSGVVATFSGTLSSGTTTGIFTKLGSGTLNLTAANTYSGGTNITSGILQVTSDSNLGPASSGNTLFFTGGTLELLTGFSSGTGRSVFLDSAGGTIQTDAGSTSFGGVVSGSGGLTKTGSATLFLTNGSNNYSGGTTINAGTLGVFTDSNLGASTGTLTFGGGTLEIGLFSPNFFISSRNVTLNSSGGTIQTDANVEATFNSSSVISGSGALTKTGTGYLELQGANTYMGGTIVNAGTLAILSDANLGNAAGALTFNGGLLELLSGVTSSRAVTLNAGATFQTDTGTSSFSGMFTGAGALTKTGAAGTLAITNASNNYTGGTNINSGILQISADGALGTGGLSFNGGTLELLTAFGTATSTRAVALNSSGTIQTDTGVVATFSGVFSGAGGLVKSGPGTLILTNTNTYGGTNNGTTINNGVLQISSDSNLGNAAATNTITFSGGTLRLLAAVTSARNVILNTTGTLQTDTGTSTFSGQFTGSGGLIKTGAGTLALTNTSSNYAGGTTINAGILQIGNEASLGAPSGSVTFGGGTLELLTAYGTNTSSRSVLLNSNGTIQTDTGVTATFAGTISGAGSLTKSGPGLLALTGSNSYGGGTTIAAGTLQIGNEAALGALTSSITFSGVSTLELLSSYNAPSSMRNVVLNANGTIQTDGSIAALFEGAISGTGSLTKAGTGTLTLGASNSYSGGTNINAGILAISNDNNLGIGGSLTFTGISTLELTSSVTSARAVTLNANATFQTDTGTSTFSGLFTGAGSLTKTGSGTLALTNASNNYAGGTNITGGILQIAAEGALGSGNLFLSNGTLELLTAYGTNTSTRTVTLGSGGGTIDTDSGVIATFSNTISGGIGSGALTKTGLGTLALTASNNYSGGTIIDAGVLQLGSAASIGSGEVSINGGTLELLTTFGTAAFAQNFFFDAIGATIQTDTGVTATINGTATGSGSLTKSGTGILIFSSEATYSGLTTINAGTLGISGNSVIDLQGGLQLNGSGIFDLQNYTGGSVAVGGVNGDSLATIHLGDNALTTTVTSNSQYFGSIDGANGSLVKQGSATFTLSGPLTYTGPTFIDEGTLAISGFLASSLPGGVNLAESSATFDLTNYTGGTFTLGSLSGGGPTSFLLLGNTLLDVNTNVSSIFAGVITGNGSLTKDGSGTLTLEGSNTYSGGTTINSGILGVSSDANLGSDSGILTMTGGTLLVGGSFSTSRTLSIPAGDTATIDVLANDELDWLGNIVGTGTLVKGDTGALRISGSTAFSGNASVNAGLLAIDGIFLANTTVNSGGTLGGTGAVGPVTNSGTVSPGNSIGTLSVVGNYTQTAAGTLLIEIDDTGASDLLAVSGSASLNGTLAVDPLPGSYFAGSHVYTIVTTGATPGVSGQFSQLEVLDPGFNLKLGVIYQPNQVLLSILGNQLFLGQHITKYNPLHVERYLNSLTYFSNGVVIPAQQDLYNIILNLLTPLDPRQLTNALDQLHPALFGAFEVVNSNVRAFIASIMARHPTELCCHRLECCLPGENATVWLEPFGFLIDQKKTQGQRGFDAPTGGLMLGGDYVFENNTALGLAVGGTDTYLHWDDHVGSAHIYSGFAGLFADWLWDRWYLETAVIGGWDYYKVKRHIHFSSLSRTADNKHHGYDLDAHLGAGVDFYHHRIVFQPFALADFSFLHQEGYTENGAESLDLVVHSKNEYMLRLEGGLYVTRSYETCRGCFAPGGWLSFVSDIPVFRKNYTASLVNQPGTFTARSFYKSSNRASVGLDIAYKIDCFSFSLRYGGEFGPDFIGNKGDFRFEWEF